MRHGLAVCVLLSAGWLKAAPALTLAPLDAGLSGLTVLLPTDPGFQAAVESIGAANHHTLYPPMLPYCFVLRNDTAKPVIDLSISTLIDGQRNGGSFEASPNPKGDPLLAPGQQRVYAATGGGCWEGSSVSLGVQKAVSRMASATTLVVSLDAVVFADGVFAGPDATGEFARLTAMVTANAAVAGAVLGYQSGYKSGDTAPLQQYLSSLSNPTGLPEDEYRRQVRITGTMYAGILRRHGADEMFNQASEIAQGTAGFVIHR